MNKRAVHDRLEREWLDLLAARLPERVAGPQWLVTRPEAVDPSPAALFAELEEVRLAWVDMRASARVIERSGTVIAGAWTLKDLVAHVASWASELRGQVEVAARGGEFDYAIPFGLSEPGHHAWNEEQVERRRGMTLEEVFEEVDVETRRLQEIILPLPGARLYRDAEFPLRIAADPPALWRGSIARLVLGKCMHDSHHLERIRRWLGESPERSERGG
jgi:hypothetical protein